MKTCAALFALILSSTVFAQGACPVDTSNTTPTVQNKGLPSYTLCLTCRELNKFPQDYNAALWNYIEYGAGAFTHAYYFETIPGFGGQTVMPVRVCGPLGQCASGAAVTNFNTVGAGAFGVSVSARISIHSWQVTTLRASGKTTVNVYYPTHKPAGKLDIPTGPEDDGFTPGVHCLNNNGSQRVTVVSSRPTGGPVTGGGTRTVTPANEYNGSGGPTHTRECWRIVTRDGTGKVIGDAIQCVIVG